MENTDLVIQNVELLITLLYILIGIIYVGVAIFVYYLFSTKTELTPNDACDIFSIGWLSLVWPISGFFLPFAMFDYKKQQEKKNEALRL